jgi:hypothetical protein
MSRVHIPAELRLLVLERAQGSCEYCLVHQEDTPFSHQVDHLIRLKHGGQAVSVNLALACWIAIDTKALTWLLLTQWRGISFRKVADIQRCWRHSCKALERLEEARPNVLAIARSRYEEVMEVCTPTAKVG